MSESGASKKSPDAFRTISEVADELGVAQHVLRFWETKFAQIKPMKRGGNRRYYRPEDVALIKRIHALLYKEGYTIKGAQKALREQKKVGVSIVAPENQNAAAVTPVVAQPMPQAAFTTPPPLKLSPKQAMALESVLMELKDIRNSMES
ncbi:MAG: MerR family transcriptional regulator [Alphaproteobacteria bacterium]|nr:MerR family transcriptional regulator [Alphaproteobacteria bacterium]